jgi:phage-related tail fiber protein
LSLSASAIASVPTGAIFPFAGSSAPTGYLLCDGSAVSRTTYADLVNAIGTAFGEGDGSTTFNLPDFQGRVLRGVDEEAGRDPDSAARTAMNTGGNTGDNVGSVQSDAFQNITGSATRDIYSGFSASMTGSGALSVTAGARTSAD